MNERIQELRDRLDLNIKKAVELADRNTTRNADGHVVLKKDDEWRKEDEEE